MTIDTASPIERFITKIERRAPLPPEARADLLALPASWIHAEARDVLVEENARSRMCLFVVSGLISRQKKANGGRHIMGIGVPGDAVDLQSLWFHKQDHSVVAHVNTTLAAVEHSEIISLCERSPSVAKALWHDTLVEAAIFREWTLNIGHRRARSRIAHFLLEVATRRAVHGHGTKDLFELPLTQGELADALGLSLVHLNKSLKVLRDQRHVQFEGRQFSFLDRSALEKEVGFDPAYLHAATTPRFAPVPA